VRCLQLLPAKAREQVREIAWERRLEAKQPAVGWMLEPKPIGVERVARERDRPWLHADDISAFSNERVATQPCLQPDLVPLSGVQLHLHERGVPE
jgi:hypothetical protein